MTRKQKIIVFLCTLVFTLALALAGAIPYGYFLMALGGGVETLCWALYGFVSLLLWVTVWRGVLRAVRHWPGRKE